MSKLFRDYATRISFNISLTRNQIFTLWAIAEQKSTRSREERESFGVGSDMFVPGAKWLCQHGLVDWVDPTTTTPKWRDYPYTLTEAGKHILILLQIAEIIPKQAMNSNNKTKSKKKA
jgi:hypothetical protein